MAVVGANERIDAAPQSWSGVTPQPRLQSGCVGHCHEVSTGTMYRGFPLDQRQELHQGLSLHGIIPSLAETGCTPGWALNSKYLAISETRLTNFVCQLFRPMKIGRGEIRNLIRGVALLTRCQVACYDLAKLRVTEKSSSQSINKRSKMGNCRCD